MSIIRLTSADNPAVSRARRLLRRKGREEEGAFLVEGLRFCEEAVASGVPVVAAFVAEGFEDRAPRQRELVGALLERTERVYEVPEALMRRIADTDTPQGVLLVVRPPGIHGGEELLPGLCGLTAATPRGPAGGRGNQRSRDAGAEPGPPALFLVAEGIQDPGNLGTLLRSAAAAGASGAVVLKGCVDLYNPKTLRATMGAIFRLPVVRATSPSGEVIRRLRSLGLACVGLAQEASMAYDQVDWTVPAAAVVGGEAQGLSPEVREACGRLASIPMAAGVESLNAAMAGSVCLFEAARQRRRLVARFRPVL